MGVEKWQFGDREVEVPVVDQDELETNERYEDLDKTKELVLNLGEDNHE